MLLNCGVGEDSWESHGLQHARLPSHYLPELAETYVHWVSDAIQSTHPLSPSSPPTFNLSQPSESFPMSCLFASHGQSIGVSASTSVLPMNIQGWFPSGPTVVLTPAPQFKSINSLVLSFLNSPILTSIHDYWKNRSFDWRDLVGKVMSLLLNNLSRSVITFLPRSKHLLTS